jgi:hypothetical protein
MRGRLRETRGTLERAMEGEEGRQRAGFQQNYKAL